MARGFLSQVGWYPFPGALADYRAHAAMFEVHINSARSAKERVTNSGTESRGATATSAS